MFQFLLGLAGGEIRRTARRAAATGLIFSIGAALLLVALLFLLAALYIALADRYDPLIAALLVAALAFVCSVILLLVAYARMKTPQRRSGDIPFGGFAPPNPASGIPPQPPLSPRTVAIIAVGAAVVGLIIGRRV